ncbi:MAG: hypothetical protein PHX43_03850 [Alphaproteobacteria bacterium]|nr:hypothetical protein [Alphaproteobacteria bacterium]
MANRVIKTEELLHGKLFTERRKTTRDESTVTVNGITTEFVNGKKTRSYPAITPKKDIPEFDVEEEKRQLAHSRKQLAEARKKGYPEAVISNLVEHIEKKQAAIKSYELMYPGNSTAHSGINKRDNSLLHYNESCYDSLSSPTLNPVIPEADKSKSISEMSLEELRRMSGRLREEREVEDIIRSLRRSAGLKDSYENPAKIDTKTPIDQLYHWGIPGMKWGVRRFQNKDGSRTAAGKKREEAREKSEDYIKTREIRKKGSAGLSNEELRKVNERLRLETDYKNLTTEKMTKAESFVGAALKKAAGEALSDFAKSVMLGGAKLLVKEVSPDFAEVAFKLKKEKQAT